jgi:HAD superfamily phosphatase
MKAIVIFDIDGVIRDVGGSYRKALADTVEYFTNYSYRPTMRDIDNLKAEGIWNNDWEGSQELIYRYFESQGQKRVEIELNYPQIVDFFQSRYRGSDPDNWNGYITTEKLLVSQEYFEQLTAHNISWAFFSGATRGSAEYVLKQRLGLPEPILVAMEDAPGKPDPTGLFMTVESLEKQRENTNLTTVLYLGDTVADMTTIVKAKAIQPQRQWLAVGVLPPHVHHDLEVKKAYINQLKQAGANYVFNNITELIPRFQELNIS